MSIMPLNMPHSRGARILAFVIALLTTILCDRGVIFAVSTEGPIVTSIVINITEEFGDLSRLESMARDILFLKEGQRFSASDLEDSIRALRLSGRFTHIHADSRLDGENIELIFKLTPTPLVRNIHMKGIYPFFESDIRAVMTLSPGDAITTSALEKQREVVRNFFKKEGFVDPKVTLETEEDWNKGFLSLMLTVDKGAFYRLGEFTVKGASYFSESKIKRMSKVYERRIFPGVAGRFVEERLNEDLKRILERYREEGFADCFISKEVILDPQRGIADTVITIEEGPLYRIGFRGNEAFHDSALEKELLFRKLGNRNNSALHRSKRAIVQRYRSSGYPETILFIEDETITEEGRMVRNITFCIDEGPLHIVDSCTVKGVTAFPEKMVREWINFIHGKPFMADRLDQAVVTMESAFRAVGFLNVKVAGEVDWRDEKGKRLADIEITVNEGVRTVVSAIHFKGFESITEEEARNITNLKTGQPLLYQALENDRLALTEAVSEKGYPHVEVKEHLDFSEDKSTVNVEFRANEGPPVILKSIYLQGNFKTKDRVIFRQLELPPGEPFSASRFLKGERNVRNLDILESARFRALGLAERAEEVTLLVDVSEKKPYFVEAGFGYESESGFYADTKAGDRNLFGTNRSGWVGSSVSETGYRNEMAASDPMFLGYSLSATVNLYQERVELFNQTFGTDTYGASLKLTKDATPNLNMGLGFRFEEKELFEREGPIPPGSEDLYLARSIFVASPSVTYDSRDFFLRPRSGLFSIFSVDISKGVRNSFDDFLKYDLDVRYFYTPYSRLTFAFLGRCAALQTYGSSATIPDDQLLFLGGAASVRGFAENMLRYDDEENPVGGRLALSGSLEARIDLGHNFELTAFFDTGSVQRALDEGGSGGFRSSVGGGLRYITPLGPIGALYGVKLDRRDGEGPGRWHFSIGYTF